MILRSEGGTFSKASVRTYKRGAVRILTGGVLLFRKEDHGGSPGGTLSRAPMGTTGKAESPQRCLLDPRRSKVHSTPTAPIHDSRSNRLTRTRIPQVTMPGEVMHDALMRRGMDKGRRMDGASAEFGKRARGARGPGLVAPGPPLPMRHPLGRFGGPVYFRMGKEILG